MKRQLFRKIRFNRRKKRLKKFLNGWITKHLFYKMIKGEFFTQAPLIKVPDYQIKMYVEKFMRDAHVPQVMNYYAEMIMNGLQQAQKIPDQMTRQKYITKVMNTFSAQFQSSIITRTTNAINWGRELSYRQLDLDGSDRYRWSIHKDTRVTPQCVMIDQMVRQEAKVKNEHGVTLNRLKQIIDFVANLPQFQRANPNLDWTPHYRCRSEVIRVMPFEINRQIGSVTNLISR